MPAMTPGGPRAPSHRLCSMCVGSQDRGEAWAGKATLGPKTTGQGLFGGPGDPSTPPGRELETQVQGTGDTDGLVES